MRKLLTLLALITALGACVPETTGGNGVDKLTEFDWIAETVTGQRVIEPGKVTMTFLEDRVSGRGGCNQYSGSAEHGGGKLKIGPLISTKMACMATGVMQQEQEFLRTLEAAQSYAFRDGDRLVLTTATGGTLVFKSAPRQQRPE